MTDEKQNLSGDEICKGTFWEELQHRREIPRLVDALVASFSRERPMAHLDRSAMPDVPSIVGIVELLQSLIFPGYFGRYEIERHNLVYFLGEVTIKVFDELSTQVARALRNTSVTNGDANGAVDFDEQGRVMAIRFLERLPQIRRLLAKDVQAAYEGDPAAKGFDEIIFSYPGLKAVMVYRVAHALHVLETPLIPRIMTEWAHKETGIDIHPGATIGEGFFIDHGTGVVIGETTLIGRNVQIYQGVTLGALRFPKDENGNLLRGVKRHPTIEDNVTIYAHATILGGDTVIGQGAVVGGNVWLTRSVPPGAKVVIEMPQIRLQEDAKDGGYMIDYCI